MKKIINVAIAGGIIGAMVGTFTTMVKKLDEMKEVLSYNKEAIEHNTKVLEQIPMSVAKEEHKVQKKVSDTEKKISIQNKLSIPATEIRDAKVFLDRIKHRSYTDIDRDIPEDEIIIQEMINRMSRDYDIVTIMSEDEISPQILSILTMHFEDEIPPEAIYAARFIRNYAMIIEAWG